MPFGIKDPFTYKHKSREVIRAKSYDTCPVCDNPVATYDNRTALVPCLVPPNDSEGYALQVILGCQSCYVAQRRFGFMTIHEFKDYRTRKVESRSNPDSTVKKVKKPAKVGRPKKPVNILRSRPLGEVFSESDVRNLVKAARLIIETLGALGDDIEQKLDEQKQISRSVEASGLPTEDDDFGMTPEQEKRLADVIRYRGLIADAGLVLDEVEVLKTPFEICVLYNLIDLDKEL